MKLPILAQLEQRHIIMPRCDVGANSPEYKYIMTKAAPDPMLPKMLANVSKLQSWEKLMSSEAIAFMTITSAKKKSVALLRPRYWQQGTQIKKDISSPRDEKQ